MKKIKPSTTIVIGVVGTLITIVAYSLSLLGIISIFKLN